MIFRALDVSSVTEAATDKMAQRHISKGRVEFCLTLPTGPHQILFLTELNSARFYRKFYNYFQIILCTYNDHFMIWKAIQGN